MQIISLYTNSKFRYVNQIFTSTYIQSKHFYREVQKEELLKRRRFLNSISLNRRYSRSNGCALCLWCVFGDWELIVFIHRVNAYAGFPLKSLKGACEMCCSGAKRSTVPSRTRAATQPCSHRGGRDRRERGKQRSWSLYRTDIL